MGPGAGNLGKATSEKKKNVANSSKNKKNVSRREDGSAANPKRRQQIRFLTKGGRGKSSRVQ